jgi:hypothetical protein
VRPCARLKLLMNVIRFWVAWAGVSTVREDAPLLPAWVESPPYVAVMVTEPALLGGV